MEKFVIGLDYGSDSARAVLYNAATGEELAASVMAYPRWKAQKYCDARVARYRQHPLDYIEVLEYTVKDVLSQAGAGAAAKVVAMSFDTTASTPVLLDKEGTPLALLEGFEEDPDAMFVLWKDHTALKEADEINALARKWKVDYTQYSGGTYSAEWAWSKVLHVLRANPAVREKAWSWAEHCDWMPALLTGNTRPEKMYRSRCAAGHKAMWNEKWGGLPSDEFLTALDPMLAGMRDRLYTETMTGDKAVGHLVPEWAYRLGLPETVVVGVGSIDAHVGAVGAGIAPKVLTRVIGTSTCDILVDEPAAIGDKVIPGICGQVDGSVVPGLVGMEAGQSAFGDIYAWFKNVLAWDRNDPEEIDRLIVKLSDAAAQIPVEESTVVAVDWMNGRRTPEADQNLKGALTGLTLGTTAPQIFKALVEATAFGSRAILERFRREGTDIESVVALGGIARKSSLVMQTLADVLKVPIKVAAADQTCALGAAIFAAVAGGLYPDVPSAQKVMACGHDKEFFPIVSHSVIYDGLYRKYQELGKFVEHTTA